ncbi:hypothetical protein [Rickettsia fournieri]|nr:hypothetical protein [Rickettsia fournieri]
MYIITDGQSQKYICHKYTKTAPERRIAFASAKSIWDEATKKLLAA